jgi:hypothetical protein
LQYFSIDTNSILQISPGQIGIVQTSFFQEGKTQIGITEVSSTQKSLSQASTAENSITQVNASTVGLSQNRSDQITFPQIGFAEVGIQVRSSQPGLTQVDATPVTTQSASTEVRPTQVDTTQTISVNITSSETALPFNITLDHLVNRQWDILRHLVASDTSFTSYPKSTFVTWTEFLTGTTPFNLNIEITDLPTGQLAEANITHFDSNGRPTSGTLTLDTDANGLGWFIDSTPWENSEFGTLNAETFFRATPGSAAYGHYDLLTTILHVRAAFASANTRPPRGTHQRHPHPR